MHCLCHLCIVCKEIFRFMCLSHVSWSWEYSESYISRSLCYSQKLSKLNYSLSDTLYSALFKSDSSEDISEVQSPGGPLKKPASLCLRLLSK